MRVRLLGRFEIQTNGKAVALRLRQEQGLLAYLLLNRSQAHRRERLAGLFWPEAGEANARSSLRHALWRIRKAFDENGAADRLEADDLTICLRLQAGDWLDVSELEAPIRPEHHIEDLARQVQAYGGELLPGFYEDWVQLERGRLAGLYERKLGELLEALLSQARWSEAAAWAEQWIAQGGAPEPAYRALMLARAAQGNLAAAGAAFRQCQEALQRELGVEPSPQTQAVHEALRRGEAPAQVMQKLQLRASPGELMGAWPRTAAPQPASAVSRLPTPLTRFIGRQSELADVLALLDGHKRLVTLTGAGGCGKTRLAIQAATLTRERFAHGAHFVDLSPLTHPDQIAPATLEALGLHQAGGISPEEMLEGYLQPRQLLLVLDNCEYLVAGCARLALRLLQACPELAILATSREVLDMHGEAVFHVPPLALPESDAPGGSQALQSDAVQLFVERAADQGCDAAGQASLAALICRRLDGIPLAIELAAARTRLLSLEQIAARLDDSFRLLTGGSHTSLPHHETLRATLDWSYNLLDNQERRLFWRLALFAGGWTLEASEAVCSDQDLPDGVPGGLDQADILDLLTSLAGKSMINVIHTIQDNHPPGGTPAPTQVRYAMLETMRQYSREKLAASGEQAWLQDRFRAYFLAFAEQAAAGLRGPKQKLWMAQLAQEANNLHAALENAFSNPAATDQGLQLAGVLCDFWARSSVISEFAIWREHILAHCSQPPMASSLARALSLAAINMLLWVEYDRLSGILPALEAGAVVLREQGEAGQEDYGRMWMVTSVILLTTNHYSEGRARAEEAIAILRQVGASWELARALWLAAKYLIIYQDERVTAWLEESSGLYRQAGDQFSLGMVMRLQGAVAYNQGDLDSAARSLQESLEILLDFGPNLIRFECLNNLGELARCHGEYGRAQEYYRRALVALEQTGLSPGGPAVSSYYNAIYCNLGFVELHLGNAEQALRCFRSVVPCGEERNQKLDSVCSLLGFACVAAVMGKSQAAACLQGAHTALWHQMETEGVYIGWAWLGPADLQEIERYQALVWSQLDPQEYAAAWEAGQKMDLAQALQYANSLFGDIQGGMP